MMFRGAMAGCALALAIVIMYVVITNGHWTSIVIGPLLGFGLTQLGLIIGIRN